MSKSKQLIAKFCEGETNAQETMMALHLMALDPELEKFAKAYEESAKVAKVVEMRMNYQSAIDKQYGEYVPIYSMAADDGENLCDLQCENYILAQYGIVNDNKSLIEKARNNYWLRESGMPLYNMGRLMEHSGLYVQRRFDATLQNIQEALEQNLQVIVVVNNDLLTGKTKAASTPNHAIVVLKVETEANEVSVFNPSTGNEKDTYSLDAFLQAWATSTHYILTVRKAKENEYNPQPVDVNGVELSDELKDLIDTIAEHVHDVWGAKKKQDNPEIRYAPLDNNGNEQKGCNHFFRPYAQMPFEDKKYDLDMVTNAIKLLIRLGYRIVDVNKLFRCPDCGNTIEPHHNFCSFCGRELEDEDFMESTSGSLS